MDREVLLPPPATRAAELEGTTAPAGGPLRVATGHAARIFLGLVFLLAGLAKAVDPAEFAFEMASYGIVGARVSAVAGPILIALEIVLGVALLAGVRTRAAALVSTGLMILFLGVKSYALSRGRTDPCGCFGSYLETSPGWGLAIDCGFTVAGALTLWGLRRRASRKTARATLAMAGLALCSLGLVLASPSLPIDRLVTRLGVGRSLKDLGIEGKVPAQGKLLVALLDLTGPSAAETAARLNLLAGELASRENAPRVVALTPSTEGDKAAFIWTANPAFDIQPVDRPILKPLYRRLPRFFLVAEGRVVAIYDGPPPAAADLL
jgi:putative oxidoreductase